MLSPEKRPFFIKSYNQAAIFLGLNGDLNFDKLVQKSRKNTGLIELGTDFNDDALKILVKSINEEAQLNPFGKLMISEKLIGQLENRLWATHWFNKYPETLEQSVLPIVLITGLQRTGTTKMQRLLSGLAGARGLMSWEALYPAPIDKSNETNKRIGRTQRNEKAVKWISPTFQSIHPIHADQPEEDVLLLDVHFMSSSSEAIMHVPSYANWLDLQNHNEVYAFERKLLLLLQWQNSGKFWVLKSPHHLQYLDQFANVFPETQIVWMHRPVEKCIPSFLSMLFYSRCMFSDNVDQEVIKSHWLQKLVDMMRSGINFRSDFSDKIIDVSFDHFMENEKLVLSDIVSKIACIDPEQQWPEDKSEDRKYTSKHTYRLEDWSIDHADLNVQFSEYNALISRLEKLEQIHE